MTPEGKRKSCDSNANCSTLHCKTFERREHIDKVKERRFDQQGEAGLSLLPTVKLSILVRAGITSVPFCWFGLRCGSSVRLLAAVDGLTVVISGEENLRCFFVLDVSGIEETKCSS